ncbi:serine hydrolase [Prauserella halophila]|uniref:Serine hydrolase n=1 Tax=Prauserella halophila TaxID=185641 RepID=A0ABN1W5I2_9PSEU|nr:class A beta-lactamase-related serine hydrolase [Prauserella halophila]MCP2236532.1 Beta-lactamase enzyme family protein [Prauserella halophila]
MGHRVVAAGAVTGAVLAAGVTLTAGGALHDPTAEHTGRSVIAAAPGRGQDATTLEPPSTPRERTQTAAAVTDAINGVVPGSTAGLAVHDRRTGAMAVATDPDEPHYTASVVKLLIAIDVLRHHGWHAPGGDTGSDLTAMLSASDDAAASRLWDEFGGAAIVDRTAELVGLDATTPPDEADEWELTRMSPRDIVRTYTYLQQDLPRSAREAVLGTLAHFDATAADGFDQRFGLPAAFGNDTVAVKQGWMPVGDDVVLNTTGVVGAGGRFVVALPVVLPGDTDFATARDALTAGARALARALGGG